LQIPPQIEKIAGQRTHSLTAECVSISRYFEAGLKLAFSSLVAAQEQVFTHSMHFCACKKILLPIL
jgi:hypothetical protein